MKNAKDQLKTGIVLNYLNLIVGNLIPIFYTPIMLNLLGQNEYGLYKLASSFSGYLSLMSLGIGSAVSRYLIKSNTENGKEEEQKYFGLFNIIFKIIGILTFIVGVVLTLCLDLFYSDSLSVDELKTMKILVFMIVCNTAFSLSFSPYVSIVNAHEKFIFIQITNIITTCAIPALNIVLLYLGFASVGLVTSSLVMNICINASYIFFTRRKLDIKPVYNGMPTNLLKEILQFSFWVFLSNIISQLYNTTDTILIGAIPALATTGVAIYNVGTTFSNIVNSLTMGISTLLSPKINKLVFSNATNDDLNNIAIRTGRIQSYIISLLVSGFIAFGEPFINFYAGNGYEDAYLVAIFIMIPNIIPMIQSVYLNILIAKNLHKFRSIVYFFIALLNIVGTWLLLNKFGIIGAALMTGMSLLIGQGLIMNLYYYKKVRLNIIKFWRKMLPIYITPSLLCVITLIISNLIDFNNIIIFVSGIIIFSLLFAVINWAFVMNSSEKELIIKPIKTIKHKIFK